MQVEWLGKARVPAAFWRDAVDVDAHQLRHPCGQRNSRLFDYFTPRGVLDGGVFGLHVAARQQPTVEPPVIDQ